jgi:hypothetical protein
MIREKKYVENCFIKLFFYVIFLESEHILYSGRYGSCIYESNQLFMQKKSSPISLAIKIGEVLNT